MSEENKIAKLRPGEVLIVGGKIYGVCADCERFLQVNKFLFGSMHICLSEEERKLKHG